MVDKPDTSRGRWAYRLRPFPSSTAGPELLDLRLHLVLRGSAGLEVLERTDLLGVVTQEVVDPPELLLDRVFQLGALPLPKP